MPAKLAEAYYKLIMHQSNTIKKFLIMETKDGERTFCYIEKGHWIANQPSVVFVHGFSSDKYTWLPVMKNMPDTIHCIAIDMPFHGETKGFDKAHLEPDETVHALKEAFNQMNLTEPICLVGTSMGGSVVSIFAAKYPSLISMICLLAPVPPGKEYETDMLRNLRHGKSYKILPETREQFIAASTTLSMRKYHFRRLLAQQYFKTHSSYLDQHKTVLKLAFENEYPILAQIYETLQFLQSPALIIWGKQDQLCTMKGAEYFSNLLANSKVILFDNCGHLITNDKPKETAESICQFWNFHHSFLTKL